MQQTGKEKEKVRKRERKEMKEERTKIRFTEDLCNLVNDGEKWSSQIELVLGLCAPKLLHQLLFLFSKQSTMKPTFCDPHNVNIAVALHPFLREASKTPFWNSLLLWFLFPTILRIDTDRQRDRQKGRQSDRETERDRHHGHR